MPNKKSNDPRITAVWNEDRTEYMRQKKYVQLHPECTEIPPKIYEKCVPTYLITVKWKDDALSYKRQYDYLRNNPDAEYIPESVIESVIKCEGTKIKKGRRTGETHRDSRVTVRRCDDLKEYKRQLNYLNKHPDCIKIPPRQRN